MKTQVNTPVKGAKKVTAKNVVSEPKPAKVVSNDQVKESKAAMRTECRTLAYALKLIIETKGVNAELVRIATKVRKDSDLYKKVELNAKRTKAGNFSPSLTVDYITKIANGKA